MPHPSADWWTSFSLPNENSDHSPREQSKLLAPPAATTDTTISRYVTVLLVVDFRSSFYGVEVGDLVGFVWERPRGKLRSGSTGRKFLQQGEKLVHIVTYLPFLVWVSSLAHGVHTHRGGHPIIDMLPSMRHNTYLTRWIQCCGGKESGFVHISNKNIAQITQSQALWTSI